MIVFFANCNTREACIRERREKREYAYFGSERIKGRVKSIGSDFFTVAFAFLRNPMEYLNASEVKDKGHINEIPIN